VAHFRSAGLAREGLLLGVKPISVNGGTTTAFDRDAVDKGSDLRSELLLVADAEPTVQLLGRL